MAISDNMRQALLRAGLGILGNTQPGVSGAAAFGQGALQGLDFYQQKQAADQQAAIEQQNQQGLIQQFPQMEMLIRNNPEIAAKLIASQQQSVTDEQLRRTRPVSALEQAKLDQDYSQQNNTLGMAQQKLALDRQKHADNLALQHKKLARSMFNEGKLKPTDIAGMRKEFTAQSKEFIAVRDSYNKVKTSASSANPVADISTIFAYMKMLDPASVVREGEQATAANARAVPDTVRNLYNRVTEGTKLTPEQRAQFTEEAENLMNAYQETHMQLRNEYTDLSNSFNIDPEQVIVDYLPKPNKEQKKSKVSFEEYFN